MPRTTNQERRRFLATAAAAVAGLELTKLGGAKSVLHAMGTTASGPLAALRSANAWLNSKGLTEGSLRGKSVLVNFCTYTCINWLRSLPFVRAWEEKYRTAGLIVIGVHTPEFGFEHDIDNVRRALKALGLSYPIAVDNDYAIWKAFENNYWPALYLVDGRGVVRDRQFGESSYDQSERMIQRLLREAGATGVGEELVTVDPRGVEAVADWRSLASPELYLGLARTKGFVSSRGSATGAGYAYSVPERLRLNEWALAGDWTLGKQAVALNQAGGRIVCRFRARDLHLVMGPAKQGASIQCRVQLDGKPPESAHGVDSDEQGLVTLSDQRLYQLIRQARPIEDRDFEIEFLDPGVEAFGFTFG